VVVVSISGSESEAGVEALHTGAVDVVQKPTAMATERLYDLGSELVEKVLAAAEARTSRSAVPAPVLPPRPTASGRHRIIVIGASTGGPPAVQRLLSAMPANLRVPIAVVIHLPVDYTQAFADRLDGLCAMAVREATDGAALEPGVALIARGGVHLCIRGRNGGARAALSAEPLALPHRPAVDVLFASAAEAYGAGVMGVVLTGMGDDGLAGARAIKAAGGTVITESEASCVVYGMPRCVREAGLSDAHVPLEDVARSILERL
jgi:two-component system chemotaxis response regulator CheB